jgi:ATP-dependent DNA helicase RecG
LLLLGKKPKFTLHGANIQYVRFGGITNGSPILNELRFEENILLLVPRLDDFLDAAVIQHWPVPISTLQEKMLYNCPRRALRELLMNVIMHRDYQSNAPIRLYQYEDRLEIMNTGGLYGNARPENFPTVNDYRNPVIAEAMKVMDYVNMFSRGVGRQDILRENGNAEAVFELDKITVFNVVIRENSPKATEAAKTRTEKISSLKSSLKILAMIEANPSVTTDEMAEALGLARRSVTKQLTKLKNEHRIRRVGPDKGGRWEVLK